MPQTSTRETQGSDPNPVDAGGSAFESIRRDLRRYVEKRIEWLLLVLTEPFAFLAAKLLQMLLGVLVAAVAVLMIWLALALALSQWVGSLVSGFLLSSIPLLLVSWWLIVRAPGYLRRKFQREILGSLLDHYGNELARSKRRRGDETP